MKKSKLHVLGAIALAAAFCVGSCNSATNSSQNGGSVISTDDPAETKPITRDIEFMAFMHHFAEDPEFQLQHVRFPLGKLSYANIPDPDDDGNWLPDDFTERYWLLSIGNYMRVDAPGYFTWLDDNKIKYDYNSSLLDEPTGEFGDEYTFEKLDGEWDVTQGDYYGSDVGIADDQACYVASRNKEFLKAHTKPFEPYVYDGTPGDYPQASDRLLTDDDLQGLDKKQLRLMRNEIMARHGYTFQSKDLAKHFNALPWYSALFRNVEPFLTDIEKENIAFIKSKEK